MIKEQRIWVDVLYLAHVKPKLRQGKPKRYKENMFSKKVIITIHFQTDFEKMLGCLNRQKINNKRLETLSSFLIQAYQKIPIIVLYVLNDDNFKN